MPQTEALKPEDLGKTASQPTAAKPAKVEASLPVAKPEIKKPVEAKPVEKAADKPKSKPEAAKPSRPRRWPATTGAHWMPSC
jgi:hypothetical protein